MMETQDEYVPLFPLLAGYWDKPLSELPEALQARLNGRVVKRFIVHDAEGHPVWEEIHTENNETGAFIVSWDVLEPDLRKKLAWQIDYNNDPKNEEERTYRRGLGREQNAIKREIEKWELMHPQSISEAKIQEDKLAELRSRLAEIERLFKLPPPAAGKQAAPAAKGDEFKNNDAPPGKMPNTGIGKLAIKAAWQIECASGRCALVDEVIKMLQEWVKTEPELLDVIKNGVKWQTQGLKSKPYDIDACSKTLETWHKSRA